MSFHAHFAALPVADLASKKQVVTVKSDSSVEEAVFAMQKHSVLSLPVTDRRSGELAGFVDVLDVAAYLAKAAPQFEELQRNTQDALEIAGRAIALVPVTQAMNQSGRDGGLMLFDHSPSSEAVGLFSRGVHRAVVFSKDSSISGVISQSDINRHLAETIHVGPLKELNARTLSELGFANGRVQTIARGSSVLQVVQELSKREVSALAVVDEAGRLVANFSASDLRGLYRQRYPDFLTGVTTFLEKHSPKSTSPITIEAGATFGDAVRKLAANKLHHLWVVDGDGKPVNIVSLTDIMRVVANA